MTQTEYEQKKRECWEECAAKVAVETTNLLCKAIAYSVFDRAFALGKQEKDADTVIQGWVGRDKDGDLTLFYGSDKPKKKHEDDYWRAAFGYTLDSLPKDLFSDLTWESEPLPVEIIIKRKKNGNNSTDNRI